MLSIKRVSLPDYQKAKLHYLKLQLIMYVSYDGKKLGGLSLI